MANRQWLFTYGIAALAVIAFASPCANATGTAEAAGVCPESWGCGGNAATVGDGIVFDELNSKHRPLNGLQLLGARVVVNREGERAVELSVVGHDLSATDKLNNTVYKGPALKGMIMTIGHSDGRRYEVRVENVCDPDVFDACQPLDFWVHPKSGDRVPYYELKVRKTHRRDSATSRPQANDCHRRTDDRCTETDFKEQVCKGESLTDDVLWDNYKNAAIFFEGDRFHADSKTVSSTVQTDGWFNLACAGAAIAKMHLLRHTAAGGDSMHWTTLDQRTAMLKMLTADFCGDGTAWTADGTPLFYTDARGWYPTPPLPLAYLAGSIEALWGPTGALCLNAPRRKPNLIPDCKPPAVTRAGVMASCTKSLPVCDQTWLGKWTKQAAGAPYVLSAIKPSTLGFCNPLGP